MEIDKSLISTISNNGGNDVLTDLGEITLDSIIGNDLVDEIPVIKTLKRLYKISNSISDHLFIQKLLKFMRELENISDAEKDKMILKIEKEKDYKIGENLLDIINRIDDSGKPRIIANIFKAYINEEIDFNEFRKFAQIVNRSHLPDLLKITYFSRGRPISNEYSSSLLNVGLIMLTEKKYFGEVGLRGSSEQELFEYKLNRDGIKMLYILYPDFEIIQ